jgi:hypothetical protein
MSAGAIAPRAQLRPSVLPLVDRKRGGCVQFLSEGDSPVLEEGRDRHIALKGLWLGDRSLFEMLSPESQEGVQWAHDYMRDVLPRGGLVEFEKHMQLVDADFEPLFPEGGHLDVVCGPHIVDLKWRPRDYTGQLIAYALMRMQELGLSSITVHCLYAAVKWPSVKVFSEADCWRELYAILEDYLNPELPPSVGESCGWCSRKLQCAAFNAPAIRVAQGREDWGMQTYHVTQITTPDDMAKAIQLASLLRKWCDAVDYHKRRWAINQGIKIPGYTIREELGDREIVDINEALRLSGLPLEKFLGSLDIGIGKLKKIWAQHKRIPEAAADREINKVLAPIIRREPKQTVVREKEVKELNQ